MEHTAVDTPAMVDVGRALGRVSGDLEREIADAATAVAAIAASWHGGAASAFADGWAAVHHGAREMVAVLAESARTLEVAATTYARQDESTAAAVAGAS
ncbi:WXG100 family type VII secretion target [Rhodococcus sp. MEB064]|uniref:WXG100 family type VII secretion target n=1 Tax=Rhodococcus sp. MEB064 TaxID=1587522 RepID=UPI0005ACB64B|nr:WXG100 family type VII secretion target [Rhodococcus sp. MEB064]KIQ19013.1 hypothetical protein RU01_07055 [Rhodococcus sp. MEB064]